MTYYELERLLIDKHIKWPDVRQVVPIHYLLNILFSGLKENFLIRFKICFQVLKNIFL